MTENGITYTVTAYQTKVIVKGTRGTFSDYFSFEVTTDPQSNEEEIKKIKSMIVNSITKKELAAALAEKYKTPRQTLRERLFGRKEVIVYITIPNPQPLFGVGQLDTVQN